MKIITLPNNITKVVLDKSDSPTHAAVIFCPGVSGKAFSKDYDFLSQQCLANHMDLLRVQSWDNTQELEKKTIRNLQDDILQAIKFLNEQGYTTIFAIGKSLSGGILLSKKYPKIKKMALWAPSIGINKKFANLNTKIDLPLSKIKTLTEVTIDKTITATYKIPILIINGDRDEIVQHDNSNKIAKLLPLGNMITIMGLGHSPKTKDEIDKIVSETINFLIQS